jgi:hypothetical protein
MRYIVALLIISLCAGVSTAQKRKKPAPRTRSTTSPSSAAVNKPRIIGAPIVIITKNGDRITGELLDLTAYSARIRSNNLESSIALDTVASLSFGEAAPPSNRSDQMEQVRPDFGREAQAALGLFQTLAGNLKSGIDYTEYGRQLTELRRAAERFIGKNSSTDNATEARVITMMAAALTDYSWARTIWTLKFGRSTDGTIAENDSPVVMDMLLLYPDLRAWAAAGSRLSVEKLIGGAWQKAAEKIDRAVKLVAAPR